MKANPYQAPNSSNDDESAPRRRPIPSAFVRGAILGLSAGAPCGVLIMVLIRFMQYQEHQPMRPVGVDIVGACFGAITCGLAGAAVGGLALGMLKIVTRR